MKKVVIFFVRIIAPLFFKKRYLKGKYFHRDKDNIGWIWVAKGIWRQKILGFNRSVPWPICHTSMISNWENIIFNLEDVNNFQSPGCYFQNFSAKIILGQGTYIAPNVGLITANHDLNNLEEHSSGNDITIGKKCWIGMNSVILPGVKLGDNVIVGAGSVVTKSFEENNITIAGVPAKIIKKNQ
ncbi:DapH/DapD/GlmU-related protein [Maribacter litoralis]|uniref:DapH/DapD/GlmU-related protein n=1 Tax=Maribacter litoralis TaxID=2059726 RepID=UPI001FC9AC45|nr:DapH/DapD/GlmU-related protein [Maribacter litoralis]